ncbi:unnamed protein product [Parascedosporium putredinis]|uniref:Uncharacterized protein n=1 Tax=Parascedosporium putredinis TaxID=1442378 RepID=A0A9P1GW34_9PEZI|nr:unnamed protein product [Parascedosporium putredinis]CAI7988441.1 unnamed protein product [Parascedosporium putredinis]
MLAKVSKQMKRLRVAWNILKAYWYAAQPKWHGVTRQRAARARQDGGLLWKRWDPKIGRRDAARLSVVGFSGEQRAPAFTGIPVIS